MPIGLLGIVLATRYIEDLRAEHHERFDLVGMVLAGLGIAGVAFGLSVLGLNFLPWTVVAALVAGGACFIAAYMVHARHTANPALDLTLFQLPTFRASVVGGFMFRLGIGAMPFLLPLMLQVGFGMTPFQSGLITFATALGAMGMKMATATMLRRFGFRTILVINALISAGVSRGLRRRSRQRRRSRSCWLLLLVGGFFRSLQFTSINTIAYAEVEPRRVSRATALVSVGQQLSISDRRRGRRAGGGTHASLARATAPCRRADFPPAFLAVAAISALSVFIFLRLPPDAGAEMADRTARPDRNRPTERAG